MKNTASRARVVLTSKSKSETADESCARVPERTSAHNNSLEFLFSDSASEMDDTEIQDIAAPRQSQIRDLNRSSARFPDNESESSAEVGVTPLHPHPPRAHYTSSPMRGNTADDFVVFPPFAIPSSAADTVLIVPTQEEFSQFAQASPRRAAGKKHEDGSEDELDMLSSISAREKENVPASSSESTVSSKKSHTPTPSSSDSGAAKPHSNNILSDKRTKSSSDSFSIESLPLPPHISSPLTTTNSKAQSTKNATGVSIVQKPKEDKTILDSASTTAATESKHKATGKRTRDSASAERERDKPISSLLKGPVYRVGLSKRARVESLHSYLRRES